MPAKTQICKNCEKEFNLGYSFCPHCGQQAKDDLTVGVLFYNTISNYFSFDARFFKSFLPLMIKPGHLPKKFIEGKRLLFLHPAQMYLFVSVIFFLLMSVLVVRDNVQNIDKALKEAEIKTYLSDSLKTETVKVIDSVKIDSILKPLANSGFKGLNTEGLKAIDSLIKTETNNDANTQIDLGYNGKKVDSLIKAGVPDEEIYSAMGMNDDAGSFKRRFYAQSLKFLKQRNGGQILQAVYDTIPVSLFILLPMFALILKLFFLFRGSYAHHLVFSFYYFSFLFSVFSIILIINYFVDIPFWIEILIVLSTFFYLLAAIKKFYRHGWILSFIKSSIITFLYLAVVTPIAFIILLFLGFLYY